VGLNTDRSELQQALVLLAGRAHGFWAHEPNQGYDETGWVSGILEAPEQMSEDVSLLLPHIQLLRQGSRIPHVVVLFDGLDRMTNLRAFEEIVRHDVNGLASIGIGVVLVGPLRALYGIDRALFDLFEQYYYQPWVDVERDANGRDYMRTVLTRRAPQAFNEASIDALVQYSGGVVRDLLALAQSACVEAYMHGADTIGRNQVEVAIDAFGRKQMQGLRPGEIEILRRVQQGGEFVHTSDNDLALLMTRRVLEYRGENEKPRYVVHPTIRRFLNEVPANVG
jgi:hypothetical protein